MVSKSVPTPSAPPVKADDVEMVDAGVEAANAVKAAASQLQSDISSSLALLVKSVSLLETRHVTRALRATAAIRRRLTSAALSEAVGSHFPAGALLFSGCFL